jgi:hypothetical protein
MGQPRNKLLTFLEGSGGAVTVCSWRRRRGGLDLARMGLSDMLRFLLRVVQGNMRYMPKQQSGM